jgi:hypothetical protein
MDCQFADLIFNGLGSTINLLELEYCFDDEDHLSPQPEMPPFERNDPSEAINLNSSLLSSEEFADVNLLSKIAGLDDDGDFYIEMDNDLLFKLNSSTPPPLPPHLKVYTHKIFHKFNYENVANEKTLFLFSFL